MSRRATPRRRVRRAVGLLAVGAGAVALTGCSNHSLLNPRGPAAGRIANLGWLMITLASVITLFVFVLMLVGLWRDGSGHKRHGSRLILYGGLVMPSIVLLTMAGLTVFTLNVRQNDPGTLHVEVIGHQYWWEVRYPGTGAVTANEIHIPAGREVEFTLRTDDVIHSFWVPSLAEKTDLISGQTNHLTLKADHPGRYRGQCAEFCGLQHAHMIFYVIADPPAKYQRWLQHQAQPAASTPSGQAAAGKRQFLSEACAGCHTVRGTPARGHVGPDLTHVAQRATLASGTFRNRPDELRHWIGRAQEVKPGALMPNIPISPHALDEITVYLESLR